MTDRYDIAGWISRQLDEMSQRTSQEIWLRPDPLSAMTALIQRLGDPNIEGTEEVIEAILAFRTFRANSE